MSIFNHEKKDYIAPTPEPKKPSGWKIMISTASALFAISHLGLLGYLIDRKEEPPSVPTINLPRGPYSSYKIEAGKDGYKIEYVTTEGAHLVVGLSCQDGACDGKLIFFKSDGSFSEIEKFWIVPLFTSIMLFTLAGWIFIRLQKRKINLISYLLGVVALCYFVNISR